MRILAIETSCDETSAAIVEKLDRKPPTVISSHIASSSELHTLIVGIIPEQAAREQLHYMIPIVLQTLFDSQGEKCVDLLSSFSEGNKILNDSIDAIAVTLGPGLIGSLLVGVETAKTFAYTFDKPIIPVNHLLAHLYANFIGESIKLKAKNGKLNKEKLNAKRYPLDATPSFPFIGLIVSGGHTDLLYFEDHGTYKWIGGTRDDAAGEALDKIGRVLGLPYPAGPEIEKQARHVTNSPIKFSRPLMHSDDFDFSFSGLKTEAARFIQKKGQFSNQEVSEVCFAIQDAVTDILVHKTLKAAREYNCNTIVLGGGVSANDALKEKFELNAKRHTLDAKLFFPKKKFTTDNAAMIGAYATYHYHPVDWKEIKAQPELHFI